MTQPSLKIRSPLLNLVPNPRVKWSTRMNRIVKRVIVFLALIAIPIVIILSIYVRLWSADGLGYALYFIHDTVFLPLKGQIHTRNLPLIFVLWGFIATLTGLILLSRFTDQSFIKRPHVVLLRFMIRQASGRWLLRRSSRLFGSLRQRPTLILTVAEQEWESALIHLSEQTPQKANSGHFRRVIRRLDFIFELRRYYARSVNPLMLLEQWHYCLMSFYVYLQPDVLRRVLPRTLPILDKVLKRWKLPPQPDNLNAVENLFHPHSLLQDIRNLYALSMINAGGKLPDGFLDPTGEAPEIRLHRTWAARRKFIDDYNLRLQAQLSPGTLQRLQLPQELNVSEDFLPFAGRLSLNIALHFALLTHAPMIWQSYQDALDSLQLLVNVTTQNVPPDPKGFRLFGVQIGGTRHDVPTPLERAALLLGNYRENTISTPFNQMAFDTFLQIEAQSVGHFAMMLQHEDHAQTRDLWADQRHSVIERHEFVFETWEASLFDDAAALVTTADQPMPEPEEPDDEETTLTT